MPLLRPGKMSQKKKTTSLSIHMLYKDSFTQTHITHTSVCVFCGVRHRVYMRKNHCIVWELQHHTDSTTTCIHHGGMERLSLLCMLIICSHNYTEHTAPKMKRKSILKGRVSSQAEEKYVSFKESKVKDTEVVGVWILAKILWCYSHQQ